MVASTSEQYVCRGNEGRSCLAGLQMNAATVVSSQDAYIRFKKKKRTIYREAIKLVQIFGAQLFVLLPGSTRNYVLNIFSFYNIFSGIDDLSILEVCTRKIQVGAGNLGTRKSILEPRLRSGENFTRYSSTRIPRRMASRLLEQSRHGCIHYTKRSTIE